MLNMIVTNIMVNSMINVNIKNKDDQFWLLLFGDINHPINHQDETISPTIKKYSVKVVIHHDIKQN